MSSIEDTTNLLVEKYGVVLSLESASESLGVTPRFLKNNLLGMGIQHNKVSRYYMIPATEIASYMFRGCEAKINISEPGRYDFLKV
tara:strand:- start:366 stop:623 length:258 start_codon:yes stop_codon:yes gene_type:complete